MRLAIKKLLNVVLRKSLEMIFLAFRYLHDNLKKNIFFYLPFRHQHQKMVKNFQTNSPAICLNCLSVFWLFCGVGTERLKKQSKNWISSFWNKAVFSKRWPVARRDLKLRCMQRLPNGNDNEIKWGDVCKIYLFV